MTASVPRRGTHDFSLTSAAGPYMTNSQGDRIFLTRLPFLSHSVCFTALTKTLRERRRAQVRAPGTDLVYTPAWRGRL